ncbi:MAG: glycosyltransferase, partial [Succinivibrionaceae bacterium]|nr:glycosyltransferase [Succinivibrionaceae bacterium]
APGWQAQPAGDGRGVVVREGERLVMYAGLDPGDRRLLYINWLLGNRTVRRDFHDEQGFISASEFPDPETGRRACRIYYRPDHTVALTETLGQQGGEDCVTSCNVMDAQGLTQRRFCYQDELVCSALLPYLAAQGPAVLVAEAPELYQRLFLEIKRDAALSRRLAVVCLLHNCHTLDPLNPQGELGQNYLFLGDGRQQVNRLVALTGRQRADLESRFPAWRGRVEVIPNFLPRGLGVAPVGEPQRGRIIVVGRLCEAKQPLLALRVFARVLARVPHATLHFYGVGALQGELGGRIASLGLGGRAVLHGFSPSPEEIYGGAELLLCTSRHEGLPLVLCEALARGVPVVSLNCRYGPEAVVRDGVNGYLVEPGPGEEEALAERVSGVLGDPGLRARLSQAAPQALAGMGDQEILGRWAALLEGLGSALKGADNA